MRLFSLLTIIIFSLACEAKKINAVIYEFPQDDTIKVEEAVVSELERISYGISVVAESANAALVFISTAQIVSGSDEEIDPFDYFFGAPDQDVPVPSDKPVRLEGHGSGFIVDLEHGFIMTNNHVIAEADEIYLKFANGEIYDGQVVGRDPNTDIAVVKIAEGKFKREGLMALRFADSNRVKVGDLILALGSPFGLEASISLGVISALERGNLGITPLGNFTQTDAAINPGNSGGPLLNMRGQVIGVNTAIFSKSGSYNGIGFAVPANLAKLIGQNLINDGEIRRGFLGVGLQEIDEKLALGLDIPRDLGGAIITSVEPEGPAAKAGLKPADIIIAVDGQMMQRPADITNHIGLSKPGSIVELAVIQQGKEQKIKVTLAEFPKDELVDRGSEELPPFPSQGDSLGLRLEPVSTDLKKRYQLKSQQGLIVIDVDPRSGAAASGIKIGDAIVQINGESIQNSKQLQKIIKRKKYLVLRLERAGDYFFVGLNH